VPAVRAAQLKTHVDPATNVRTPWTPVGRFLHVPTVAPVVGKAVVGTPWWCRSDLVVGALTRSPRTFRVVNTLTSQADVVQFAGEDMVGEMQAKFHAVNRHCTSYTWKAMVGGGLRALDPAKTMADNGVADDSGELERVGLDRTDPAHVADICMWLNDDLTVA
jgi:hypothetical protein